MPRPEFTTTAPASTSVIHDISYQRYEGLRLGRAYMLRVLLVDTLRGAYGIGRSGKSKIMPVVLFVLTCLPALIATIVVNATGDDELPFFYREYAFVVSPLVVLFVAGRAPACVARDLRFRMIPLYLSRPLRRTDYVQAKFGALAAAMFILMTSPLVILYVGALLAKFPAWQNTKDLLLSLAGVAILSVMLAGIGLVIAAITPRRGLGVTSIVVTLIVLSAVQGTLQELGEAESHPSLALYSHLLSPWSVLDMIQAWMLQKAPTGEGPMPSTMHGLIFVGVSILLVLVSYWLLLVRYRRVSVS